MESIGIIILNWNWYNDTIECIESLLMNSFKSIKIILIDNDSKNCEWKKLNAYFWDRIIFIQNNENSWFAWWCNIWIQKAIELWSDYILLFNNDAVAEDWFIEKLLTTIKKDNQIWIIWPAIRYYHSNTLWFWWWIINYYIWTPTHKYKWKDKDILKWLPAYETDYVSWCCILIQKNVIDTIWLLDEEYFAYNEEVDFCFRARKAGFKCLIEPGSMIEHKKSASTWNVGSNKLSEIQAYLMARNWRMFWNKNLKWPIRIYFNLSQYLILPIFRIIFQIRSWKVLKSYIKWLLVNDL